MPSLARLGLFGGFDGVGVFGGFVGFGGSASLADRGVCRKRPPNSAFRAVFGRLGFLPFAAHKAHLGMEVGRNGDPLYGSK